jgi:hypothetical protein
MWRRKKRTRKAPKARSKAEKCLIRWCRNKGAINSSGRRLRLCWKCRSRQLKKRHPETYVLNSIRQRTKARGLPFTITLVEFRQWCRQTNYLELRGQEPNSMTIDRIDHDKGYHIWNIQLLNHAENSANGHVVPGRETKQNEPRPEIYDYDFAGPAPDYQPPTDPTCPF